MSKWTDIINKFNPNEDDLCDLLDEAEKVGRADAIEEFCNRIEQRFDEAREQGIEIDMCNIDIIRRDMENERI